MFSKYFQIAKFVARAARGQAPDPVATDAAHVAAAAARAAAAHDAPHRAAAPPAHHARLRQRAARHHW